MRANNFEVGGDLGKQWDSLILPFGNRGREGEEAQRRIKSQSELVARPENSGLLPPWTDTPAASAHLQLCICTWITCKGRKNMSIQHVLNIHSSA